MQQRRLIVQGLLLLFSLAMDQRLAQASCRSMDDLITEGAYAVADSQGRVLDGCNADRPLVPASILKIATISAALAILGPDYRFRTEFFIDGQQNLFIKGFGDPSLVSEEIVGIAKQLQKQGLSRVAQIFVDSSAFALEHQVPGQEMSDNPYDAPIGALSVNFNAVPLVKESKDKGGRIGSAEPQTPTLPLMAELAKNAPVGRSRINVCTGGCEAVPLVARYSGELFTALLLRQGIAVGGGYGGLRSAPAGAHLLYTHQSRQTLLDVSRSTLAYSSNFMANLIFLACGAERLGYPATWGKARRAVRDELVRQMGSAAEEIIQIEGSGLSRENRVSAAAMLRLLAVFRPHQDLLNLEQGVALKTGTLTNVHNLAGYLPQGQSFVIVLNQSANNRAAVLARLKEQFAGAGSAVNNRGKVSGVPKK